MPNRNFKPIVTKIYCVSRSNLSMVVLLFASLMLLLSFTKAVWNKLNFHFLLNTLRSIIEKLGHERISKIRIVGKEEVEQSFYGQLVFGEGVSSSLDEQLAKEARKAGRSLIFSWFVCICSSRKCSFFVPKTFL